MTKQNKNRNPDISAITKIIQEIEEKSADAEYIYRGIPKDYGKISSSLYRVYKREFDEGFSIVEWQEKIISEAIKYTSYTNENKTPTRILSELQHYGGKTNLIDFTADYRIALFFACDGEISEDGRVILQKKIPPQNNNQIITPKNPLHRVIAQKIVFVSPSKGYIDVAPEDIVNIPKERKEAILNHLRKYHGISIEMMYNDLQGFIRVQQLHKDAYTEFQKGNAFMSKAENISTPKEKNIEYDKAIQHYDRSIRLVPNHAIIRTNRGIAYANKGDYDEAIANFNKAIELNPNDAETYINRGVAYSDKEQHNKAIADFNKVIELNPNYAKAYYNRSIAYNAIGEPDKTIADYDKAIELNPNFAEAYVNRGIFYGEKSDHDKAITDFNKAIKLNPNNPGTYINLGSAYDGKGDYKRAITEYGKAIKLNPNNANAYINRGITYDSKEEYDKAIADYDKAIELNPNDAEVYFIRGNSYSNKSDYDKAIANYDKAIGLNPKFLEPYKNRSIIKKALQDIKGAKKDLQTALKLAEQQGKKILAADIQKEIDAFPADPD